MRRQLVCSETGNARSDVPEPLRKAFTELLLVKLRVKSPQLRLSRDAAIQKQSISGLE